MQAALHPFPRRASEWTVDLADYFAGMTQGFYVVMGFGSIPAMAASYVVRERELGVKAMQLMMGIMRPAYWLSLLLFDLILAALPVCLVTLILCVENKAFAANWAWTLLVIASNTVNLLTFGYLFSLLFSKHTTAQTFTLVLVSLGGTVTFLVSIVMQVPTLDLDPFWSDLYTYIFLAFPPFGMATGLTNIVLKCACPPGVPQSFCDMANIVHSPAEWAVCGKVVVSSSSE